MNLFFRHMMDDERPLPPLDEPSEKQLAQDLIDYLFGIDGILDKRESIDATLEVLQQPENAKPYLIALIAQYRRLKNTEASFSTVEAVRTEMITALQETKKQLDNKTHR